MVFFHFFNGQQKLINGSNGLTTNTTELYGLLVGSSDMKLWFYRLTVFIAACCFSNLQIFHDRPFWRCFDCDQGR